MIILFASKGTSGGRIELMTNCFKLKAEDRWLLYQYHVDFSPMIESPRARQGLLRFHTEALGNPMAFDGMILFLLRKLEQPVSDLPPPHKNHPDKFILVDWYCPPPKKKKKGEKKKQICDEVSSTTDYLPWFSLLLSFLQNLNVVKIVIIIVFITRDK